WHGHGAAREDLLGRAVRHVRRSVWHFLDDQLRAGGRADGVSAKFSYDEIADRYAAGVDTAPYNALYERPAVLAELPEAAGARVLDAGCGAGWYAAQLALRGASVTAIDSSAEMIRHARERFAAPSWPREAQSVALHLADCREPFTFATDGAFDGILSSLALHY